MKVQNKSLSEILSLLPEFATVVKSIDIDMSPSDLLSTLEPSIVAQVSEGIIIFREHGSLLIRPTKAGKSLKIYSEANNTETANELCAEIIETLLDTNGKKE